MKYKKLLLTLIFTFISVFVLNSKIYAAKINVNVSEGNYQGNVGCSGGSICAKTYPIIKNLDEPIDGMRVILRNKSTNDELVQQDIWFSKAKADAVNSDKYIDLSYLNNYTTITGEDTKFFNYANYINSLSAENIEYILKIINSNYTLKGMEDYYMVIEPIFVFIYTYTAPNYVYTFKGTPAEIENDLVNFSTSVLSDNGYAATAYVNRGAYYFAWKDYSNCISKAGEKSGLGSWGGSCQNYNVIKNYFTSFKLSSAYGPYTDTNCSTYTDVMASNYDTNTCGKGIITISDFLPKTGTLKIKKTNSNNDPLAQLDLTTEIRFKLYNNSSCTSGTEIKDFKAGELVQDLSAGTYYLKEYQTKIGYHLPQAGEDWYCKAVEISAGETEEINITNKTECEFRFDSKMSMKERIDLYNYIKSAYKQEFNGLLSLNNISAQDACRNVPITKSYNTGCFSAKSSITNQNSFSESNVSMYTEHYGSYTFCLTKFNLERKLDSDYFGVIKTGKSIISSETAVAVGNLERVCYNYGDSDSVIPSLQYRTYIGTTATIDPNNTILDSSDDISLVMNEPFKKKIQNGRYIKETYTMKFTLPRAFASNGTGKLGHGSCLLGKNCKYMGKSVLAKFNLYPTVKYDALGNLIRLRDSNVLNFNINLNEFGNKTSVSSCKYDTINELINYKDKIALEFRITNTNSENLFLGKNGNERTPGTNWVGFESILKSRNNSYNKTGEGAKYSITLTPEMIKQIRDYNKSNSYDDYNLTCENDGNICISNYLTQLRNNYGLKIYESEKRNVVEKRLNITNTNLGNWKKEGSDTYYIDSNGNKVTGWQQLSWDGGINWFYFEPDGKMVKSEWRLLYWKDKEDWYYFSSNGEMLTGWQELNWDNKLNWFYLEPEGRLKTLTGWQKMDADWYYFDSDGQVSTGWKNINDVWYYFDLSGKMLTGWQSRDGVWYYLEPSGQMTTGWRCADNICYYLSPSGAMLTGWQYIASNWHYFASNGVMLTGWQKIGDNWYYLNPSGVMLTGWQKIGDNWYYLEPSGQMVTGWKNINNNWYYLESSGQMTTGWKYIDNVWYYFENSGACTEGC